MKADSHINGARRRHDRKKVDKRRKRQQNNISRHNQCGIKTSLVQNQKGVKIHMKKVLAVLLCGILLLGGCGSAVKEDSVSPASSEASSDSSQKQTEEKPASSEASKTGGEESGKTQDAGTSSKTYTSIQLEAFAKAEYKATAGESYKDPDRVVTKVRDNGEVDILLCKKGDSTTESLREYVVNASGVGQKYGFTLDEQKKEYKRNETGESVNLGQYE